mgnify:FL=1
MQVDLHIHSTASDGTWTPPEVVAAALAAGLGAIAVTDHDSVANVAATHELAVAAELKFIPGAEICSTKAISVFISWVMVSMSQTNGCWIYWSIMSGF